MGEKKMKKDSDWSDNFGNQQVGLVWGESHKNFKGPQTSKERTQLF
jgi:hypothetical protein